MVTRIFLLMLLSLCTGASWASTIKESLDRNTVSLNESFVLTFIVHGELHQKPDFSPVKTHFDIINRSQNTSMQFTNGALSRSHEWQLTLMARTPGEYTIPSIAFGKDRSNQLALTVEAASGKASASDDTIILEVDVTPKQVYIQSQVIYTVRLLRSVQLNSGTLSEPEISGVEAIIEKHGDDRNYNTERNGISYLATERTYVIFPQQSGSMKVKPIRFSGEIPSASRFRFGGAGKIRRLVSETYDIKVMSLPADAKHPWLPSQNVMLIDQWAENPPHFKAGEPVTRTITLIADGIAAAQLPKFNSSVPYGIKQYADQPITENRSHRRGVRGMRQEKIAIVPSHAGQFELPAIEIPWWNTETDRPEIASIPARSIMVEAASVGESTTYIPIPPAAIVASKSVPEGLNLNSARYWPWVSLALLLLWITTCFMWWRTTRTPVVPVLIKKISIHFNSVKKACANNNTSACKTALISWAQGYWPDNPPTSLSMIAARVDTEFSDSIYELNRVLYAVYDEDWDGSQLLRSAENWIKTSHKKAVPATTSIVPLHPRHT